MRRDAGTDGELEVLDRIALILVALAGIAGRVATAPAPVRILVLWALRKAEVAAAAFVSGSPARRWPAARRSGRRAGPAALAASLRRLAVLVKKMVASLRRDELLGRRSPSCPGFGDRYLQGSTAPDIAPVCPDTS